MTSRFSARLYGRYRHGTHFWEDTNNNARVAFAPPPGIPQTLYIPDLTAKLAQIGTAFEDVIADLDGSFSKYYEGALEAEYRGDTTFIRGSYTYSHYYGNFDQDDTTGAVNDMNTFIGSSNIGDGAGRQLWNFKYGTLRGDRPHLLKIYGAQQLPWRGSAGFFFVVVGGGITGVHAAQRLGGAAGVEHRADQRSFAGVRVADHGYVLEMGEIALQGSARELAGDTSIV